MKISAKRFAKAPNIRPLGIAIVNVESAQTRRPAVTLQTLRRVHLMQNEGPTMHMLRAVNRGILASCFSASRATQAGGRSHSDSVLCMTARATADSQTTCWTLRWFPRGRFDDSCMIGEKA